MIARLQLLSCPSDVRPSACWPGDADTLAAERSFYLFLLTTTYDLRCKLRVVTSNNQHTWKLEIHVQSRRSDKNSADGGASRDRVDAFVERRFLQRLHGGRIHGHGFGWLSAHLAGRATLVGQLRSRGRVQPRPGGTRLSRHGLPPEAYGRTFICRTKRLGRAGHAGDMGT